MAKVRPENGSPRSSPSSDEESSDVPVARNQGDPMRQRRKRVVVHHNANVCKFFLAEHGHIGWAYRQLTGMPCHLAVEVALLSLPAGAPSEVLQDTSPSA